MKLSFPPLCFSDPHGVRGRHVPGRRGPEDLLAAVADRHREAVAHAHHRQLIIQLLHLSHRLNELLIRGGLINPTAQKQ